MRTIQALAGAVLQDYDDYDASLLNSITSHAAQAITLDFTPQGNHTERVQLLGRAAQLVSILETPIDTFESLVLSEH